MNNVIRESLIDNLKEIRAYLKKESDQKFEDFIKNAIKSIKLIYSNPEKFIYNIEKTLTLTFDHNEYNDSKELSKKIKFYSGNKLLQMAMRVILNIFNFFKTSKYQALSSNQKFIYVHIIRLKHYFIWTILTPPLSL